MLPEYQDRAVDLLADILRPSLRQEDFDTEKQVILEEIRMYEDQPPFGADEKCRAAHFGSHPLGRSVLGTPESVGDLPVEAMREYLQRRYSPGNIVLAAAGRIDFDALVADGPSVLRRLGAGSPTAATIEPARAGTGFPAPSHKATATQQYVMQLAAGPAAADADRYAAKLLATILGDDIGQPAVLGAGRPGPGRTGQRSAHHEYQGAGHVHDLPELRSRARPPKISSGSTRFYRRPRPKGSPRPN